MRTRRDLVRAYQRVKDTDWEPSYIDGAARFAACSVRLMTKDMTLLAVNKDAFASARGQLNELERQTRA